VNTSDDAGHEPVFGEPAPEPSERPDPAPVGSPPEPAGEDRTQVLKDMLAELKKLSHVKQLEEFSIWNLFAGLAQVLVFLALFLSFATGGDKASFLTLAIVLQLMALTFFTIGNR